MSLTMERTARNYAIIMSLFAAMSSNGAFGGSVFDDAKFKLDLRGGDPNGNAFVDSGEVFNAYNSAQTAVLGGGKGPSTITAAQYASGGYDSYGLLPFVAVTNAVNPADGSTYTQKCLVLPQSKKTVGSDAYWSENGIVFPQGAVSPGDDGCFTIYARFKWDGNTYSPNLLVGNGWDGTYGNTDNGLSVYLDGEGKVGIVHNSSMGSSSVKCGANVWCDLFVVSRNETINGTEKAVSEITLYKANSGLAPSLVTGSYTNKPMVFSSSKTRVTLGCYLTSNGWAKKTDPRAFKGTIADVMMWDRALTEAEMSEVMVGTGALGGEWQIGAMNGSANEFNDTTPADVYDVQTMPWNKMRKSLTAENPSLTLSTTMTSDDHKRNRTLTFTPILLSGVTSAPVEVSLNGTVVGEIDLATTTSINLPRKLWRHGSGLANTIVVTRKAPVTGTVQFDAISLATGEYGEAGGVLEDATFKLDLRGGESTYTKPGDLGNTLDYSAASPLVGYMGDQRGPQTYNANFLRMPAQETADVQNPYYPYTTNTQTVLHFYQDFKGADKGSVNSGVVIPGAAPNSLVQTYYLRFRWDGVAPAKTGENSAPAYILQSGQSSNGNNQNNGVAISLDKITVSGSTTNAVLACRIGASGTSRYPQMTDTTISAGKWVDAFVTFEANADNTGFTTTYTVCTPSPTGTNFNPPQLKKQTVANNGGLSFDSSNLSLGLYHDSANTRATTRCFRGLIADFMIWERALTDKEKIEIMAGQHGSKWTIGAANGSADEFTDDNPAEVFEPLSMEWKRMRKTLDASHPTLTLKSPLAAYETGKAMILHVDPLMTGTGASVPVSVSVNGTDVGSFDLAETHNFIIAKQKWQRENGNVTVALTRTDTTGSVAIDAITLSGSWQITPDNGLADGMLGQQYASSHSFAGDANVKHFPMSMSVGASHTNYTFGVWVPAGMAEKVGWRFRTKTSDPVSAATALSEQHTVYVNGVAVGAHEGKFGTYESFSWEIPAGTLHDGMNFVQWVQTLPTFSDQQSNLGTDGKPAGIFQFYDFWAMDLVPPPKSGMMIIIR